MNNEKKNFKGKVTAQFIEYVDLMVQEDDRLHLLSELLMGLNANDYPLSVRELQTLAKEIKVYLGRKAICEHLIFGRPLNRFHFDEIDLKFEISRLRVRFAHAQK